MFGNDGAQNPLQIPLKVCFAARPPHGISWPFSQSSDVHKTLQGLKNPLHVAAENVDFVRGLEPPCYFVFKPKLSGFNLENTFFESV